MSNRQVIKIIIFRVVAGLKAEASRYFLGMLWWIIEPAMYMCIFYFVFEVGLRGGGLGFERKLIQILPGLVFWRWFASSLQSGSNSITANKNIIDQIHVPKWMFPAISFGSSTFKLIFILLILLIFLAFYGFPLQITILALPVLMIIQAILTLGGGILLASMVPFFPDLRHIISNGLLLMFFASGIFFDINAFEPDVKKWFYLNPMVTLIDSYRDILVRSQWPNWPRLGGITLFAIPLLAFSVWHINRLSYTFSKVNRG